jgi:CubicO group peptidase (beta-lactamase class C family)
MPGPMRIPRLLVCCIVALTSIVVAAQVSTAPTNDLSGLWRATKRFAPFGSARLIVTQDGSGYRADMLGWSVPIRPKDGKLFFELPNDLGAFRGKLDQQRNISGHWFRAKTASPVTLRPDRPGRWTGNVNTLQDDFTFFLLLEKEGPHSWRAVLRNPQFDFGGQQRISRLVSEGGELKLLGTRTGKEEPVARGTFDREREAISLVFPSRGGTYDFARERDESEFYPRGKKPAKYRYHAPPALDDGWPIGTLEAVGIDRLATERFVQLLLEMPMDSLESPQVHALLIARHGKLVLEEYFHGEHRAKLHGTRSAAKSVTAILAGAAIKLGALRLNSPVYQVMNGGAFPADLEPQKRSMTLEHLLTMSSGHFCDDTNDQAPGNEDKMWDDQTEEPDFYRYILKVPLVTTPGENAVYCSGVANLALGMVDRSLKEFPLYSFDRLIATPLHISNYAWLLDPAGNPYGGGGTHFLPRDFIKFGQLMLNEGAWDGKQVLARDFVREAMTPQYHLRKIQYGYLWWIEDWPYKDRTVRAVMALGAGAQSITVVPELELVVAMYGGGYSSRVQLNITHEYVPRYLLPAVRQAGDNKNSPVNERDYHTSYGKSAEGGRVLPRS